MTRSEEIDAEVKQHGWFVFKVVDDELPSFAYTVGFHAMFNHPEVIISGLDINTAHQVLNNIGQDVKNGIIRRLDQRYNDILEDCDCIFKQVTESTYQEFLGQAMVYYDEKRIPFLQCVYPDESGQFPWDSNYTMNAQEVLY